MHSFSYQQAKTASVKFSDCFSSLSLFLLLDQLNRNTYDSPMSNHPMHRHPAKHTHTHTQRHTHIYACTHTQTHTHTHTHTNTCSHVWLYVSAKKQETKILTCLALCSKRTYWWHCSSFLFFTVQYSMTRFSCCSNWSSVAVNVQHMRDERVLEGIATQAAGVNPLRRKQHILPVTRYSNYK